MPALQPYLIEPIWEQFSALLPERKTDHPLGCHRPRIPDRVVFEKLVEVLVFGCAYWRIADEKYSATTLRRRHDEWIEEGVMEKLREMALETYDRLVGLELADLAVDCCITKAPCGGEKTGRSPVDRGKRGIKPSMTVDACGIPLGIVIAPAKATPIRRSWARPSTTPSGGCRSTQTSTSTVPMTPRSPGRSWSAAAWSARSPRRASPPRSRPGCGGSWRGRIRGATPTKSSSGVPRGVGKSSTSGWHSRTWSSSSGGSPEKTGPATAGKADLPNDRDLLTEGA